METPNLVPPVETPPLTPVETPVPEVITKDVFERTQKDMFKYKQELAIANKTIQEERDKKLKDSQNFQELARIREEERDLANKERDSLRSAIVEEKKIAVLTAECRKIGILPESEQDLDMLDFPEIQVNTDPNGRILSVQGADKAALRLKTLRPRWFHTVAPNVNSLSPTTLVPVSGTITSADVRVLEEAWKKSPTQTNSKAYTDALIKFKNQ